MSDGDVTDLVYISAEGRALGAMEARPKHFVDLAGLGPQEQDRRSADRIIAGRAVFLFLRRPVATGRSQGRVRGATVYLREMGVAHMLQPGGGQLASGRKKRKIFQSAATLARPAPPVGGQGVDRARRARPRARLPKTFPVLSLCCAGPEQHHERTADFLAST